ncbi:MAG: hypothetical protein Q9190_005963 [Brigantiaea leucoxantha]
MDEEVEITVGNVQYLLVLDKNLSIDTDDFKGDDPSLLLVYSTFPGQTISRSILRDFRTNTLDRDDVFQSDFCCNVVFHGSKEDALQIEPDALEELETWHTKTKMFVPGNSFTLLTLGRAGTSGRVVVPSRCYYKPSKSFPLDGARISVKDNIDIAGHKTTLCNRAWIELYPAKTKDAACVQVLRNAGAIIVCKVKLQAMIMREEPLECVEFIAPFNPRADGYQVPSGSSHASAAGISSYDWLDFSIGSDSLYSMTPECDMY